MSQLLRGRECEDCNAIRLAENQQGLLYLTCSCSDKRQISIRVSQVLPEEWR